MRYHVPLKYRYASPLSLFAQRQQDLIQSRHWHSTTCIVYDAHDRPIAKVDPVTRTRQPIRMA